MDVKITYLTKFDKAHGMELGGIYGVIDTGEDFYVINLDGKRYPIGMFQAVEL